MPLMILPPRARLGVLGPVVALTVFARAEVAPPAAAVVDRVFGSGTAAGVAWETLPAAPGANPAYEYEVRDGKLTVRGTSPVAMARGFHDYLKNAGYGRAGWGDFRYAPPAVKPDLAPVRVVSPVRFHYYFNVVTYGYSTPYWTWERWEKELDAMALHGIDLPLALVANEAISERVWKRLGLTQAEIDATMTGPAHLPWMRMGNIAGHDGPLPPSWHADQIALQHRILDRMKELGITPICPAFAGFVPKALKRVFPDAELHATAWGGFPAAKRATFLSPDDPAFDRIGRLFIEEWEKEFGKGRYYLADSFNEMELPETGKPADEVLAGYGEKIWRSISAANPDAVWVMQGWMFGYQRHIWTPKNLGALVSRVPRDRMLLLDLAADYNATFWRNGMNYDFYKGFFDRPWVYSVIPNMGGKTFFTGDWKFYAAGFAKALASPNRGRLEGAGVAGEGIENNELLHELATDAFWSDKPLDLDAWLAGYSKSRYGKASPDTLAAWTILSKTCDAGLIDHPNFGWQTLRRQGSVKPFPAFYDAARRFLAASAELKSEKTYADDAVEFAALALGMRADEWFRIAYGAHDVGDAALFDKASARGLACLSTLDRLLESHPYHRLERWIGFARAHGESDAERDAYEANARRIVTSWGPPINDYSCRVWSGLVRDFYAPRLARSFAALKSGAPFDRRTWEESWVRAHGLSPQPPFPDPVAAAREAVESLVAETLPAVPTLEAHGEVIGEWSRANVAPGNTVVRIEIPVSLDRVRNSRGVLFVYKGGSHRLDIRAVSLIADGREVARNRHAGTTGLETRDNLYHLEVPANATGNNSCVIRCEVRADGGPDSRGVILLIPR